MSKTIFGGAVLSTPQVSRRPTSTRATNNNSIVISSSEGNDDFFDIKQDKNAKNMRLSTRDIKDLSFKEVGGGSA